MDAQLNKKITLISIIIVIGTTPILLLHAAEFSIGLCLLACAYIAVALIRDYVMKIDKHRMTGILFLCFQLALAIVIWVGSESFIAQIYILILIGEFTLHNSNKHSIIFTIVSYACCVLSLVLYGDFPPFEEIYVFMPRVVEYFAIFGISLLAKIAFQQKNQLARDNEQLRIASIQLERKAQLQERTRISREIHDSVGHTLTSALTGLQTAAHAIKKSQYSLAEEMVDRTKQYILSGLDDVRSSVHLLQANITDSHFMPELMKLIEETKKQTNVEIVYDIDRALPELPPMIEITLYRALQEGLTNGIRHGSSTCFHFSLTHDSRQIRFVLSDNGRSPAQIVMGFGLNAMKERVKDVGGEFSMITEGAGKGVTLDITIPYSTKSTDRTE